MACKRASCVLELVRRTSFVLESADEIAKQVGSEGKQDVVISADDIAKQVGSVGNQSNVGHMDRRKRVANGKGKRGS